MASQGKRNILVKFQTPVYSRDSIGSSRIVDWNDVYTCWGEWLEARGNEKIQSDTEQMSVLGTLRVRYNESVTESCRVSFRNSLFNIWSIRNQRMRNIDMFIDCIEYGVSDGR